MAAYTHGEAVGLIWSIADLLRGTYKAHDYGDVILPLVVLRRLDQALLDTKPAVLERDAKLADRGIENREPVLRSVSGRSYYNTSPLTFDRLLDDEDNVPANLRAYIEAFSPNARDVIEKFGFDTQIDKLHGANLLYPILARFVDVDLHPDRVSNLDMGYLFEELIRRFAEQSNETAGEHFTPREVIALCVELLAAADWDRLSQPGAIVTMLDCCAGTGGMASVFEEHLRARNSRARLIPHLQEINDESYAICKADLLIKGQDADNVAFGNSLTEDAFPNRSVMYALTNPPFGVDWKGYAGPIEREHAELGHDGRFGPGLPAKGDGQLLFLLHLLSKLKPYDHATGTGGGRLAIIMNGSPLFSGAPGGGESEVRRYLIENDLLETIVALPDQLFYNTGISTYIWVITNRKAPERAGHVQLIDARQQFRRMRKSLGAKRNELADEHIERIVDLYHGLDADGEQAKLVPNHRFGFRRVTIERPLRARYEGGAAAVDRLRTSPDWNAAQVRKSDADRAEDILAGIEQVVADLPTDELTTAEAVTRVKETDGYTALLKKAKDAIAAALTVPDPDAEPLVDAKGHPQPDPDLRGQETVPLPDTYQPNDDTTDVLTDGVEDHLKTEVLPHAPDAWVDHTKTKLGYEIPFTRIFYRYQPPRPLAEIDADIKQVEAEILQLLAEVTE
ncbi:N-6 DNA methylase [Egicoccus sp. AB-alg2]|uniref:type I restriction-modification system subunit M n=1 Tax=Egicoccus sp. AB-alg2 TaxID=3242693 RepID=UPI00359EA348